MNLNKIIAGVLEWAGTGCTCEIERMDKCWDIRVSKDGKSKAVRLSDAIYSVCKDSTENMLQVHGRHALYTLSTQ